MNRSSALSMYWSQYMVNCQFILCSHWDRTSCWGGTWVGTSWGCNNSKGHSPRIPPQTPEKQGGRNREDSGWRVQVFESGSVFLAKDARSQQQESPGPILLLSCVSSYSAQQKHAETLLWRVSSWRRSSRCRSSWCTKSQAESERGPKNWERF